jgi:hypothetical protein
MKYKGTDFREFVSVGPLLLQPAAADMGFVYTTGQREAQPSSAASSQMASALQPACDVTKFTRLVTSNSGTSSDQTAPKLQMPRAFVV